jgi:hypothetical protein
MVTATWWVFRTWFWSTLALAGGCLLARWLGGPGWGTASVVLAALCELWLVSALAREWRWEGELRWWWPR